MKLEEMIVNSIRKSLSEVAPPRSRNERKFMDQHTIEFYPHPVALDSQFTGTIQKDTSRIADYQPGEDEEVYDQAYATEETKMRRNPRKRSPEKIAQIKKDDIETTKAIMRDRIRRGIEEEVYSFDLQEISKKVLGSYIKRAAAERGHAGIAAGADDDRKANVKIMKKRLAGIKRATDKLMKESVEATKEAVEVSHDRYLRSHGKKAKGTGGWMFTSNRMGDFDHNDEKQVYSHPGSASFSDAAKGAKAWAKKHGHSAAYVAEHSEVHGFNLQELAKKVLDETFTAGGMSFRDGTKVVVKEADANLLNSLFKSLDAQRQKEMKEHISESLANYKAVLEFVLIAKGR